MKIKQSVINTFNRVGIDYSNADSKETEMVCNRFTGDCVETTQFVAGLINWVYRTSNKMEMGISKVRISDFDRVRYFVLEVDKDAYMTCLD